MRLILFYTHLIIILILLLLLYYSIQQYNHYTIVNGTVLCSKEMNFCLLTFMEKDKKMTKDLPYSSIKKAGLFSVKVAISKQDSKDYIILGSNQIFYGTKFKILLYFILFFISILSFSFFLFKSNSYK